MGNIEQSVADIFNDYMKEQCNDADILYQPFSLGGQDRNLGADYLISDATSFALIEFKFSENQLRTEGTKDLRKNLCILLEDNEEMRNIHDRCHFVAWRSSYNGDVFCTPYREEICNQKTFKGCKEINAKLPRVAVRKSAETFCRNFLVPPPHVSVSKGDFEKYMFWLMTVASQCSSGEVHLMARYPGKCKSIEFESIDAAYEWMNTDLNFSFQKKIQSRKP